MSKWRLFAEMYGKSGIKLNWKNKQKALRAVLIMGIVKAIEQTKVWNAHFGIEFQLIPLPWSDISLFKEKCSPYS